jgi:protein N-terminal methyltransferase
MVSDSMILLSDLIWCQWVLGQLKDSDLVAFLRRCKPKKGGFIVVKENISKGGVIFDEEDSSVTRSTKVFKEIFERAGLKLVAEEFQTGFPPGMFRVKMWLLQSRIE